MSSGNFNIFVGYSHGDSDWLKRVDVHLKPLTRGGQLICWSDQEIKAGDQWRDEITRAISIADVAVLLVSADFYASDFIARNELPPLLEAAKNERQIAILVVHVNHSRFSNDAVLSSYQSVNAPGEPIAGLGKADQERVFQALANRLEILCEERSQPALHEEQAPFANVDAEAHIADSNSAANGPTGNSPFEDGLQARSTFRHDVDPYPGLRPLDEQYAHCIFGRESDISEINDRINDRIEKNRRFLMIAGPSGVGKSSLVRAGVLGRIDPLCAKVVLVANDRPAIGLSELLADRLPLTTARAIRLTPGEALIDLEKELAKYQRLVILIDQFERVYAASKEEIEQFAGILTTLYEISKCVVVATQRIDQLENWSSRSCFQASRLWDTLYITHIQSRYLEDVIVKPAIKTNNPAPDRRLVDKLLDDFEDKKNATPLLALTLRDLYEQSGKGASPMALEDYQRFDGLSGIVEKRTEHFIRRLKAEGYSEEELLDRFFTLLVDVNENGVPISKSANRQTLENLLSPGFIEEELIKSFILRTEDAHHDDGGAVALAHDVYLTEWPALQAWVESNRDELREIRDIEREAKRWASKGRSSAYLVAPDRLTTVEEVIVNAGHLLEAKERKSVQQFLDASIKKAKREESKNATLAGEVVELITSFILRSEEMHREGGNTVALDQDVYLAPWPTLQAWVESNRGELRYVHHIEREAKRWASKGRSPAYLLAPDRLSTFDNVLDNIDHRLEAKERLLIQQFLDASVKKAKREEIKTAILAGEVEATNKLIKEGVKMESPMPGDPIAPFFDAIFGDGESEASRRASIGAGSGAAISKETAQAIVAKGFTPLHFAALAGRTDKIELMVASLGLDPDVMTTGGMTPLGCAALAGRRAAVELLLRLGADPTIKTREHGTRPADWASKHGHTEIADLLLDHAGFVAEALPTDVARGLIIGAVAGGHSDQLKRYLEGCQFGQDDRYQIMQEALLFALREADPDCIKLLIEAGAKPFARDERLGGMSPFLNLAATGKVEALKILSQAFDEEGVNARDNDGWSAISLAVYFAGEAAEASVDALLELGVDPAIPDENGNTPLMLAAQNGRAKIARRLIEDKRTKINVRNTHGVAPLHFAVLGGHQDVVQLLLQHSAESDLNEDNQGNSPLLIAAGAGNETIVRMLLDDGRVNPRSYNKVGHSALIVSARGGFYPIVTMLLQVLELEDVNHVDKWGWTALNHAYFAEHGPVVELLEEAGARRPLWSVLGQSEESSGATRVQLAIGDQIVDDSVDNDRGAWPVTPLPIDNESQWRTVEGPGKLTLLTDLANAIRGQDEWINAGSIHRLRTYSLSCYSDGLLCEAETELFDGTEGLLTFINTPKACVLLDGGSPALHQLNAKGIINLSGPEEVLQYLKLFCASVQGDEGPFVIISDKSELEFLESVNYAEDLLLSGSIEAPSNPIFDEESESWKVSATVLYARHIFHADFKIGKLGIIEMTDDDPQISEPLPVRVWGFWGNIRTDLSAKR